MPASAALLLVTGMSLPTLLWRTTGLLSQILHANKLGSLLFPLLAHSTECLVCPGHWFKSW
ncbi:hypothetical protein I79_013875 [Cricetulus griseus]|uniref:Uncharacterized protein n=1 Tax=Cricetulus griseus TaxID=10029 RepID=G3HSP1_CRIGR|nr:hypothetical protein I79_013875 [Cricetulus griseus]